ncbi:MAG: cytochrome P460 family protein [Desulfuromonadales bacterium]
MRKRMMALTIAACAISVGLSGIALAGGDSLPQPEGEAVYEYITETNPYQEWALYPGTDKLYEGQHPHGALLTTYVSKKAEKAITSRSGQFPDDSIIVKENYMPDETLGAVTVMYRVDGYNPDAGDWFWAKYKADGDIEKEGKVAGCIGCHTAAIENDWVFTGPVK